MRVCCCPWFFVSRREETVELNGSEVGVSEDDGDIEPEFPIVPANFFSNAAGVLVNDIGLENTKNVKFSTYIDRCQSSVKEKLDNVGCSVSSIYNHEGHKLGSGFLIAPDVLLTSKHMLLKDDGSLTSIEELMVSFDDKALADSPLNFEISDVIEDGCAEEPRIDYVLLRLSQPLRSFTPVPLSVSQPEGKGIMVHFPISNKRSVTVGDVSDSNYFQYQPIYTCLSEPGSSGSPIFNSQGDCIGFHTARLTRDGNTRRGQLFSTIKLDKPHSILAKCLGNPWVLLPTVVSPEAIHQVTDQCSGITLTFHVPVVEPGEILEREKMPDIKIKLNLFRFKRMPENYKFRNTQHMNGTKVGFGRAHIIAEEKMGHLWDLALELEKRGEPQLKTLLQKLSLGKLNRAGFTWAPWNIFIGISDQYRSDRTNSDNTIEKNRPTSFDEELWNGITDVYTTFEELCNQSSSIISHMANNKHKIDQLIGKLNAVFSHAQKMATILDFDQRDWGVAVSAKSPLRKIFYVKQSTTDMSRASDYFTT